MRRQGTGEGKSEGVLAKSPFSSQSSPLLVDSRAVQRERLADGTELSLVSSGRFPVPPSLSRSPCLARLFPASRTLSARVARTRKQPASRHLGTRQLGPPPPQPLSRFPLAFLARSRFNRAGNEELSAAWSDRGVRAHRDGSCGVRWSQGVLPRSRGCARVGRQEGRAGASSGSLAS